MFRCLRQDTCGAESEDGSREGLLPLYGPAAPQETIYVITFGVNNDRPSPVWENAVQALFWMRPEMERPAPFNCDPRGEA
jgi:hypothetical protein